MRGVVAFVLLAILAGCSGSKSEATYLCLNGPDVLARTMGDEVQLHLAGDRVEILRNSPETPNLFTAPGISWQLTGLRQARLNDGQSSLLCDEVG